MSASEGHCRSGLYGVISDSSCSFSSSSDTIQVADEPPAVRICRTSWPSSFQHWFSCQFIYWHTAFSRASARSAPRCFSTAFSPGSSPRSVMFLKITVWTSIPFFRSSSSRFAVSYRRRKRTDTFGTNRRRISSQRIPYRRSAKAVVLSLA